MPMRLLADENFPADAVEALRSADHDVIWIRTAAPGSTDTQVLERAQVEKRILLTFDKDFGELVYRMKAPAATGVILFRISAPSSKHVARVATSVIGSRSDWGGHFSVIEDDRIRMMSLPRA